MSSETLGASIGENIARFRKMRGLSQEALAEAAEVGVDTVARLEQGKRQTTRPATLRNIASALKVTVDALIGRDAVVAGGKPEIAALRRAVTADGRVAGMDELAEPAETIGLDELENETHGAWQAYVDGRHTELLNVLPAILIDARRLVHNTSGDNHAKAYRLLSTAYRLGAGITNRYGYADLSWSSAERALEAAARSDSPELQRAISMRYLAWTLVRQGRLGEAERIGIVAAESIEPAMLDRDPQRAGVFGNLLFNAASAAVMAGHPDRGDDLLAEAQAAAVRSRADFANEAGIFGPRVAALQRVENAVRAGDPESALHLAESIQHVSGQAPAFWEAGYNLCVAAAASEMRKNKVAFTHIARAYELAPVWAPQQPLGRIAMGRLVDRAARRPGREFSRLATIFAAADDEELRTS